MRLGRRTFSSTSRVPRLDLRNLRVPKAELNAKQRNIDCNPARVAALYKQHTVLAQEVEALLSHKKKNQDVEKGRLVKDQLKTKAAKLAAVDEELEEEANKLPNTTSSHTPIGAEDKAVERSRSDAHKRDDVIDHVALLKRFDWADFESAAAAVGEGFVYLKHDLASLEVALIQYAMRRAGRLGWSLHTTPDLARDKVVAGCGFRPRESKLSPIYSIAGEDVSLVGTAEISLAGIWANKIINVAQKPLPVKMAGFSHAFRRETGQGGRESRGLYRLHQFSKVELFAITAPEQSEGMFEELVEFQSGVLRELELPFRVLEMPTEELGMSAHRKVDCEVWMPSRGGYGEVSSASNCTDFQARRLNTRYQMEAGSNHFVHTLNATALAVPRILIALLETHYDAASDTVKLPAVLHQLMDTQSIPVARQ